MKKDSGEMSILIYFCNLNDFSREEKIFSGIFFRLFVFFVPSRTYIPIINIYIAFGG